MDTDFYYTYKFPTPKDAGLLRRKAAKRCGRENKIRRDRGQIIKCTQYTNEHTQCQML